MRNLWIIVAAISALTVAGNAQAAPQALGLVASNGTATPLDCSGGECSGYFGAFCLQHERQAPARGTPYYLAAGDITLLLTMPDGSVRTQPAGDQVTIRAHNNFSAVRMTLPATLLEETGAVAAAIAVAPMTTAMPVEYAGDPDPQSAEELALAVGPLREIGAQTFDRPGRISDATRLVSQIINLLPKAGDESEAERATALAAVLDGADRGATDPEGLVLAQKTYDQCSLQIESGGIASMRACLSRRHGELMRQQNEEYWNQVGGS